MASVPSVASVASSYSISLSLLKEHEPLIDTRIEAMRLDVVLDREIGTPAVRRNGLGEIDVRRYQEGIDALVKVLAMKSTPSAASLINTSLLPTKAQRMVFPQ